MIRFILSFPLEDVGADQTHQKWFGGAHSKVCFPPQIA